MFTKERHHEIMRLIAKDKNVLVKNLTKTFGVTNETIRKDLLMLEKEGKIVRTYGGAYIHESLKDSSLISVKEVIGKACAKIIEDGDTIILDGSTTALQIAINIRNRDNLTVITNSLKIANFISNKKYIKLVLTGGTLDGRSLCFMGKNSEDMLSKYYADICFVSCRGLSITGEVTDSIYERAAMRSIMIKNSKKKVLMVDLSKCGYKKINTICDLKDIDVLVIDDFPSHDWANDIEKRGIKLIQIGG